MKSDNKERVVRNDIDVGTEVADQEGSADTEPRSVVLSAQD